MKQIFIGFALFLALPLSALASTVEIYPIITNASGGTLSAKDITVCWQVGDGAQQCATTVPTFEVPAGVNYQVITTPPAGYSASLDQFCQGTGTEDPITCTANYQDGAPIPKTPPPASAPIVVPTSVQSAPQPAPAPIVPIVAPAPVIETPAPAEATEMPPEVAPTPQVITKTIVIIEQASSTPDASTTQAVNDLSARVGILESIVASLQSFINSIAHFLGL